MTTVFDLNIPIMGSVENARFVEWFVAEGEAFSRGDRLCEVETDKTVTDIEAEEAGILVRQLAKEGDEFKVGDRIGLQAAAGTSATEIEAALKALETAVEELPDAGSPIEPAPTTSVASESDVIADSDDMQASTFAMRTSPRARRLAREHGIDLAEVTGSGNRGHISGEDVLAALEKGTTTAPEKAQPPVRERTFEPKEAAAPVAAPDLAGMPSGKRIPHSMRRRTIARNLSKIKREAPHLTADMDIDLTAVLSDRSARKARGEQPPTILAYFASAVAQLLLSHRHLNATFTEDEAILWDTVNLGIAVDTEDGLVVPVIANTQQFSLQGISDAIVKLAETARTGALRPEHLQGGTFTISNPGSLGPVVRAEAVLNGPQVALLGLPGLVRKPVAVQTPDGDWALQIRPIIRAGLTFDHRALDGGPVIRFLNDLKAAIESV